MPRVHLKEYDLLDGSKKTLVKRVGDGSIIDRFDATPPPRSSESIVCPHYLELKWAIGCPGACAWCYLQGTMRLQPRKKSPLIKMDKDNFDLNPYRKIETHVKRFFRTPTPPEILNTGELSDSLMFEKVPNPFSKFIVPLFEQQTEHMVLFLSKFAHIDNLLDIDDHNQTIVSFTLNSLPVSERWERGTSSIKERIEALRKLDEEGYKIRARIDPIVPYPEESWLHDYRELVDDLFSKVRPERVTLGSLRGLRTTIDNAYDKSWVDFLDEKSRWGMRISCEKRKKGFKNLIGYLKSEYNYGSLALCKEPVSMWESLNLDWRNCRCNCVW